MTTNQSSILKTHLGELWILYLIGLNLILSFSGSSFIFSNFTSAKVEYNNEFIERSSFRFFSSKYGLVQGTTDRTWSLVHEDYFVLVWRLSAKLWWWTVPYPADLWLFLDIEEYFGLHRHSINLIIWIILSFQNID